MGVGAGKAAQGLRSQLRGPSPTLCSVPGARRAIRTLPRPAAGRSLAEITGIKAPNPTSNSRWASNLSGP